MLKTRPLKDIKYDTLKIWSKTFVNEHIIFGYLSWEDVHRINLDDVLEKVYFYSDDKICYFARYPNFSESAGALLIYMKHSTE